MDTSASGKEKGKDTMSRRAARAKLEEEVGKLDITNEEAMPLVVDDREEAQQKLMVARKVLHLNAFHIQPLLARRDLLGVTLKAFLPFRGDKHVRCSIFYATTSGSCIGRFSMACE
jgi:hypothetical protein